MYRKDVLKVAAALAAVAGLYVIGDADNFRIEKYTPPAKYADMYDGPDYEQLILQRQELQIDF